MYVCALWTIYFLSLFVCPVVMHWSKWFKDNVLEQSTVHISRSFHHKSAQPTITTGKVRLAFHHPARIGRSQWSDIYVGWPGRVHDARVFSNSSLFKKGPLVPTMTEMIEQLEIPLVILGYPLLKWLMKAYPDTGSLTAEQKTFNYRLSRVCLWSFEGSMEMFNEAQQHKHYFVIYLILSQLVVFCTTSVKFGGNHLMTSGLRVTHHLVRLGSRHLTQ